MLDFSTEETGKKGYAAIVEWLSVEWLSIVIKRDCFDERAAQTQAGDHQITQYARYEAS